MIYNVIIMFLYCVPSAPEVPFIEQAYSKHSDSITVEFGLVIGATSYIIRAENEDGFFSETQVVTSPGTVINLLPYTQYTLSVMSVNTGGRSQPSLSVNSKTGTVHPRLELKHLLLQPLILKNG